ncbi:arginine--tRNA ligase [Candidatus Pacearchaeota archaeon]|nr:arginine--tRNA ligase [Candidatus Pacearchaeota archaeon]
MKELIAKKLQKFTPLSEAGAISLLTAPPDPKLGDYSLPCFELAKKMKKSPIQIAADLASQLTDTGFEKVEAVGPYINIFINRKTLAQDTLKKILKEKERFGAGKEREKVVIEFPSPNTNKPLHIGHARNIALGQAVTNILRFRGNTVKVVNLNNDRGIHICKSMVAYEKWGAGDSPEKRKIKPDHFVGDYYVKFAQMLKEHPELEQEAQKCLQKWESGDRKTLQLWKKMNAWAFKGFKETYAQFDLKIDKEYFESKIYNAGKKIVMDALKRGIVYKKSDGAIAIDLSTEGLGEKVLLRADGTSIYITQDLYLAAQKHKDFKADTSLYVSAIEQNHHFKVLFATLKRLGYPWADKLYHLNYGMVNLESGRMKSREGAVVDSDDLLIHMQNLAVQAISERHPALPIKEKKERAVAITLAALRYYFLKVERTKDLTFRPEESLQFEGDTGPYLLYSYARAQSILAKAAKKPGLHISAISDIEKRLLLSLKTFPEMVTQAYEEKAPSIIANYAFQLAQLFNEFYHAEKVVGSETEEFKLVLIQAYAYVLKNALELLNIRVLEEM